MENKEVKEIARMQQLIDAYELHIKSVDMLIRHCGTISINYPIIIRTPLDKEMNESWRFVKSRVNEGSFFPKLKESEDEDERIIKELIGFLRNIPNSNYTCEEMAAWLEKQDEQTKIESLRTEYEKGRADTLSEMKSSWSEEDEKTLNEIFSVAARASLRKSTLFGKSYDYIKWQNWLKSLRDRVQPQPKQEWSEEDEHLSYWTIHNLTELKNRFGENYGDSGKCIDWIKQLKQRIGG